MAIFSKSHQITNLIANERGVTLIEAMIYVAMAGMLLATAVTAFLGQNKSYNRQDVITEIQQNIRGVNEMLASDIRFAGIGLTGGNEQPFTEAEPRSLEINYQDNDGDQTVRYWWDSNDNTIKRNNDIIAENIEHLRFEYMYKDPQTPTPTLPAHDNPWYWANSEDDIDDSLFPPSTKVIEQIRAVKIVILGSARPASFNLTDPSTYVPPLERPLTADPNPFVWTPVPNTGYKRMMTTIVQCRNNLE